MKDFDSVLDDLTFLDGSGTGAIEAADRTGFPSVTALEKYCARHSISPLFQRLKARDPVGSHEERRLRAAPDPMVTLLDRADASTKPSHRRKADRVRALLSELRADLDALERDRAAKAKAQVEVDRLQEELRAAKARLRAVLSSSSIDAKAVRAWAAKNGIPCPTRGRVPASVREQFEDAS